MLEGLAVPVPTLFDGSGAVDPSKNSRFTRQLCDAGVDHLFALGSLGEFPSLTDPERPVLLESIIESLTRMADAWVGCGAPSTAQAIQRAVEAEELGAEALVLVPPYYLRPTLASVAKYYREVRAATKMPMLAYNIPSLVGYALPPSLVHELAKDHVLVGIKDTSGSIESVRGFLTNAPKGFAVFPGDDALVLDSIRAGASGAVMGTGNIVPRLAKALVASARQGEDEKASELQALVDSLVEVTRAGPFPSTDKFLSGRLRGAEVGYRAPYDPLTPEEEGRVLARLAPLEPKLRPYL